MTHDNHVLEHDEDAAHLASLGYSYDTTFKREMSFWGNVSLGFTYLSPIAGVYSMFAISLGQAGPPMAWALVIALVGQFFVALIFGEVVSNYPVAGGVYPWSRRLWGRKWAWMNGWIYVVALVGTIAAVAYGAAPFVASVFGGELDAGGTVLVALGTLVIATILNFSGTRVLSLAATIGLIAEMLGAVVIGGYLLIFHRQHDLSILFDNQGIGNDAPGGYLGAFAAAALIGMFAYYGFEANGDVAEEIKDPSARVPKAMRMTLYIGGFAANLLVFSLVLAVPDFQAVASGEVADPIGNLLHQAFGPIFPVVMFVIVVAFVSCITSLQAAASRLIYSMGRDGFLPGSHFLAKFNERRAVPNNALLMAALFPAAVVVFSLLLEDALTAMVGFGTVGIYVGFQMVVLAALRARIMGWKPAGKFRLGAWAYPVNLIALVWGVAAVVNILWPRPTGGGWAEDYLLIMTTVGVIAVGWIYMLVSKAYQRGDAPAADASGPIKTVA
ncbi:APC family permease [Leucobacter luti]|uniref:Amino acid/polyamine/organocation transporter (APC superfamily) n=1 Tax=Leucobacter luti TaxID=340320 RepID=A0A4Q7TXM1_9MICO|nr:amino acid permease [Leucobacter luti]MBL3698606.1 amino acid permease [Leucobacter luti]RZT65981.1 amino acid/polyamine/organocation transporter (APC superfamily) [Leucobacter luti]